MGMSELNDTQRLFLRRWLLGDGAARHKDVRLSHVKKLHQLGYLETLTQSYDDTIISWTVMRITEAGRAALATPEHKET